MTRALFILATHIELCRVGRSAYCLHDGKTLCPTGEWLAREWLESLGPKAIPAS